MQLLRLQINNFAAIGQAEIEFGPGLNVLHGPNDLGKSTLAEAIRMALLLPHGSSHSQPYVAWSGGDPVVELTFASEPQQIWRVRKHFGKKGSSRLHFSKNGRDFEEAEQARGVDGKLREILRWGIPEPGGAGAAKGLPESFLATVLLSTQENVSGILDGTLQGDLAGSGKERIAAALQAIAQDPLFLELLRKTQEKRDAAYTEKGAPKTATGSPFREASDRVKEAREEKERWQQIVGDSEGTERRLRELTAGREPRQEKLAAAVAHHASLDLLARQTADRLLALDQVRTAENEVERIRRLISDVEAGNAKLAELAVHSQNSDAAVESAKQHHAQALARLAQAQDAARVERADPAFHNTQLLLSKNEAGQALQKVEQNIHAILEAKKLAGDAAQKESEFRAEERSAADAAKTLAKAKAQEKEAGDQLVHCELLKKILDFQIAARQVKAAQDEVARRTQLETRLKAASREQDRLIAQRSAIIVPPDRSLNAMRRLAQDLGSARGALNVGFVATVVPQRSIEFTLRGDGGDITSFTTAQPRELAANASLELTIPGVVSVRVQGGSHEAQAEVAALESRWELEVEPHLKTAGVNSLEALDAKIEEARQLDASIKHQENEVRSLQQQISPLADAPQKLRSATEFADALEHTLGNVDFAALGAEVATLEPGPAAKLARNQQELSAQAQEARSKTTRADQDLAIGKERTRLLRASLDSANSSRDLALEPFPQGIDAALHAANAQRDTLRGQLDGITTTLASLEKQLAERSQQHETAQREAQREVGQAAATLDSAQKQRESAIARRALEEGGLKELTKQRDVADLGSAEDKLRRAKDQYERLPVPGRVVTEEEVKAAKSEVVRLQLEIDSLDKEIHRAQGALEQVGGAVARERLSEAEETLLQATRREQEIETDSEAWKLLLEQMKEADTAQASNLGLALGPAIADGFTKLTRERYQNVKLDAQLQTEGVVLAGAVRETSRLSLGTRDQLSTIFRLSLAEYLRVAVVLDDQLVQSDDARMQWFQNLLYEKAKLFQIIVLTCRPGDYLPSTSSIPANSPIHFDFKDHPVRAIDLGRALQRH
jgi:hypothetical protein